MKNMDNDIIENFNINFDECLRETRLALINNFYKKEKYILKLFKKWNKNFTFSSRFIEIRSNVKEAMKKYISADFAMRSKIRQLSEARCVRNYIENCDLAIEIELEVEGENLRLIENEYREKFQQYLTEFKDLINRINRKRIVDELIGNNVVCNKYSHMIQECIKTLIVPFKL